MKRHPGLANSSEFFPLETEVLPGRCIPAWPEYSSPWTLSRTCGGSEVVWSDLWEQQQNVRQHHSIPFFKSKHQKDRTYNDIHTYRIHILHLQTYHTLYKLNIYILYIYDIWSSIHLEQKKCARPPRHNHEFDILLMEEIRRSPVEVGSLSHYFQLFIHPRWCMKFFQQ